MPNKKKNLLIERTDIDTADVDRLRKYCRSLEDACKLFMKQINDLEKENTMALALRDQADKNVEQQKQIVINNLMASRDKELALSNEIIQLKKLLKDK